MQASTFVWDITYACPLRCIHCYSESGRRPPKTPAPDAIDRLVDVMIGVRPERVAISGGEPLLVQGVWNAASRLRDAGIYVTLYTSGWRMDDQIAEQLERSVSAVAVSIDGATAETHDRIRQREGSFARAVAAVELLSRFRGERRSRGEPCFELFLEYTVVRSNLHELDAFVALMTERAPSVSRVRIGMAVPEGPGADEAFADTELLTEEQMLALVASSGRLAGQARSGVPVAVTDMRYYVPYSPYGTQGAKVAHIEPDGQLRAFGVYEAKVGSLLEQPFDVLWARALEWRNDPFVEEQIKSIRTPQDWARVARTLDWRFGSDEDKHRILLRRARDGAPLVSGAPGASSSDTER